MCHDVVWCAVLCLPHHDNIIIYSDPSHSRDVSWGEEQTTEGDRAWHQNDCSQGDMDVGWREKEKEEGERQVLLRIGGTQGRQATKSTQYFSSLKIRQAGEKARALWRSPPGP